VRAGVPDTAEADLRDALAKLPSSDRGSAMGKEKGKMAESGRVVEIASL
jgi:hypothetical protein